MSRRVPRRGNAAAQGRQAAGARRARAAAHPGRRPMRIDFPPDALARRRGTARAAGPHARPVRAERRRPPRTARQAAQPARLRHPATDPHPGEPPPAQADKDKAGDDRTRPRRDSRRPVTSPQDAPASLGDAGSPGIAPAAADRGAGAADGGRTPPAGREVRQPLRQPRPPEAPCHRPRRLAPAPRAGLQGAVQRADPRSPDALSARHDPFRGDRTRPIWLEKIDSSRRSRTRTGPRGRGPPRPVRPVAEARPEVSSVTHVVTVSATLFDRGNGMDLADVRAFGPGRLETRPDLKEPVERIAVWQDELIIVNVAGARREAQAEAGDPDRHPALLRGPREEDLDRCGPGDPGVPQAQVAATGDRPRPRPPPGSRHGGIAGRRIVAARPPGQAPARRLRRRRRQGREGRQGHDRRRATPDSAAASRSSGCWRSATSTSRRPAATWRPEIGSMRPSSRSIPRPPRIDRGRRRRGRAAGAEAEGPPRQRGRRGTPRAEERTEGRGRADAGRAAKDAEPETPPEPAMSGVADRIRAIVAMPRGKALDAGKTKRRKSKGEGRRGPSPTAADATAPGRRTAGAARPSPGAEGGRGRIREAWLVATWPCTRTSCPTRTSRTRPSRRATTSSARPSTWTTAARGRSTRGSITATRPTPPWPGPIPWAKVATDDMTIRGEIIWMDQEHDKVWAYGPGVLTQWTDRA